MAILLCFVAGALVACGSGASQQQSQGGSEGSQQSPPAEAPKTPSSTDVVQAFRDAGLEVGDATPVDQDPAQAKFIGPKTYQEGTRFLLPSLGNDSSGQVYTYASRKDLEVMKNYWGTLSENTTGMLFSWVYDKGNVLVHLNGSLPKGKADQYGQVLEQMQF
jgi:hypothetical protein